MFKDVLRSVALAGVSFKPPHRRQLASPLLDAIYDETKESVDEAISKHRKFGFSLCSDGWSDVNSHPIVNVCVMTANGQFFLGSEDAIGLLKMVST